jgi:DUF971 family protein
MIEERFVSAPAGSRHHPLEIRLARTEAVLHVRFDDGMAYALPAVYLRVESPSAEVQGHGPGPKRLVTGKRDVRLLDVQPVGHYAVRLIFDDGHDTGLYTWDYLYRLGAEQQARWSAYLAATGKGLSA